MIIDLFGSLKENFNKKVRNPFFGTFAVVVVLKNWQLFYSLLFFDSIELRTERIGVIEKYITDAGGTANIFLWAVLWTFGVLIVSYLLQAVGAYISNTYDSKLNPWIIKVSTRGAKIVTKDKYDALERIYQDTNEKLQEERRKRAEADSAREAIEMELIEQKKKMTVEDIDRKLENVFPPNKQNNADIKNSLLRVILDKWRKDFNQLIYDIQNKNSYTNKYDINFKTIIVKYGIVAKDMHVDMNGVYNDIFVFTDFGEEIKSLFLDNEITNE